MHKGVYAVLLRDPACALVLRTCPLVLKAPAELEQRCPGVMVRFRPTIPRRVGPCKRGAPDEDDTSSHTAPFTRDAYLSELGSICKGHFVKVPTQRPKRNHTLETRHLSILCADARCRFNARKPCQSTRQYPFPIVATAHA